MPRARALRQMSSRVDWIIDCTALMLALLAALMLALMPMLEAVAEPGTNASSATLNGPAQRAEPRYRAWLGWCSFKLRTPVHSCALRRKVPLEGRVGLG